MIENGTSTGVIHASAMQGLVALLFQKRQPELILEYRAALRAYKRRLKTEKETIRTTRPKYLWEGGAVRKQAGIWSSTLNEDGEPTFTPRPEEPGVNAVAYMYHSYTKDYKARGLGVLADSAHNRDIRPDRVEEYQQQMEAGLWRDLLSDPIAITAESQVVNGQHRIAACTRVDWTKVDNDPLFLLVWGVDPAEAIFADGSRRTEKDHRTILGKVMVP